MIKDYIVNLAVELNSEYPGILSEEKIAKAIKMYENSEKNYYEMVAEIDEYKKQLIEDYKKNDDKKISYYNNAQEDDRESKTFSQIKEVQLKVQELLDKNNLKVYISGGSVPYLLMNEESGRLHDDIDSVCNKSDMEALRQVFMEAGLYDPEWDSKNFSQDGEDYGFEMKIDGVPFGIYPFEYDEENKVLTQYSEDPYLKVCKVKTMSIQDINDYIMTYKGVDGKDYNTMSLEYIKLTKDSAGRPKDIVDSKKIEETGLLRPLVFDRIEMYKEQVNADQAGKKLN